MIWPVQCSIHHAQISTIVFGIGKRKTCYHSAHGADAASVAVAAGVSYLYPKGKKICRWTQCTFNIKKKTQIFEKYFSENNFYEE